MDPISTLPPRECVPTGRRQSRRTNVFDEVFYHRPDDEKYHRGVLVGISHVGLAIVTERRHAVTEGMRLMPTSAEHSRWRTPATVKRVERLSDLLDLVAACFPETGDQSNTLEKP